MFPIGCASMQMDKCMFRDIDRRNLRSSGDEWRQCTPQKEPHKALISHRKLNPIPGPMRKFNNSQPNSGRVSLRRVGLVSLCSG